MNKVFTSYISLLYSVQRNIEWSADFPLFGLVTTHADIDIWSDLNPKYLRIPLPDYVYLIFSSPLPPNSLFNQVDTRYEYERVHGKTFLIRGPVLCFVMGSKTLSAGLFVLPGFELGPVLHGSLGHKRTSS